MKLILQNALLRSMAVLAFNVLILNFLNAQVGSICPVGVGKEPQRTKEVKSASIVNEVYFEQFDGWENLKSTKLSDDNKVKIKLGSINRSRQIIGNNFKFQIPAGSTINGITLMLEGQSDNYRSIDEVEIMLMDKEGDVVGQNKKNSAKLQSAWKSGANGQDHTWMYGSDTDTWGAQWKAEDINHANFGFVVQIRNIDNTPVNVVLDQIILMVDYTPAYSFCDDKCLTFYIDKFEKYGSYKWSYPDGFNLVSSVQTQQTIDLKVGTAAYGVYKICVDVFDKSGLFVDKCCRDFIYQDCTSSEIKGVAWTDLNDNKLRDNGENGIKNLSVILHKIGVGPVDTTVTDQDGRYHFKDLEAAKYFIKVPQLAGKEFVTYSGADPDVNSDITHSNGQGTTDIITTEIGKCVENVDLGYVSLVNVGDLVWHDLNFNGLQDSGEPGIPSVQVKLVTLAGNVVDSVVTDGQGKYLFKNIHANKYYLKFKAPADFKPTHIQNQDDKNSDIDANGKTISYTFTDSGTFNHVDAGFFLVAKLGDFAWEDKNGNGIYNAGEPPLQGVEVFLTGKSGDGASVQLKTITDNAGRYYFSGINPGIYTLTFTPPSGYFLTTPIVGDDILNSDPIDGKISDIAVLSGALNLNLDAGYYRNASIGNLVWEDLNGNGIKDGVEIGLANVKVTLIEIVRDGIKVVGTTFTDANGFYIFENLKPGSYKLIFEALGGYYFTATDRGLDDKSDSDANQSGQTGLIPLTSGNTIDSYFAGLLRPASIGDFVWEDVNGNGIQDSNESGLSDISLILSGETTLGEAVNQRVTTDANGRYDFINLSPGTYHISMAIPNGFFFTTSNQGSNDAIDADGLDGKVDNVSIESGTNISNVDFGLFRKGQLGDYVWEDINGNGLQESGETGLAGVGLTLTGTTTLGEQVTQNTTTDATGRYSFVGILPGTYKIGVTKPAGYTLTASDRGSDDNIDSDGIDGLVSNITVGSGTSVSHIDFGMYRSGEIGDFVWEDGNGNGRQEGEETGKSGVNLTLQGTDGQGNPVSRTTTTNEAGAYRFEDLPPGQYRITITIPDGYSASKAHEGTDENVDSDFENNESGTITLGSGQVVKTVDGGMYRKATLGDFVWHDVNANGIQEANEPGVSGVELTLTGVTGIGTQVQANATTNETGHYAFSGIEPGTYTIRTTLTGGYEYTISNKTDDQKDSDVIDGNMSGITVKSGTNTNDLDVGIYKRGSIGDYVWEDKNGNARQDADEIGVGEIKVVLTGTNGFGENISQNTKTRADGTYGFDQIIPGNYELRFEIPAPYQYVKADEGSDDDKDSDVKDGKISGINLQSGQSRVSYDAGIYTTTSIGDYVWEDINGNGLQESGETGLAGVGLTLTGATTLGEQVTQNTTTDAIGRYSFVGILPGTYKIGVTKPAGYTLTASDRGSDDNIDSDGIDGLVSNITVGSGTSVSHIDFGMYRSGEIGDFVWEDENGNGRQEGGEVGKSGVNLTLQGTDGQGNPVSRTTTTNEVGAYRFEDLPPGQYRVTITIPDGYSASKAHEGTDENVDSDFENNESGAITLGSGQVVKTVDGGMYRKGTLGDFVWHDVNANGIQEVNEPGVGGVELTLTGVTGIGTQVQANATTNETGHYAFSGIEPGTYTIRTTLTGGYEYTISNKTDDQKDSDAIDGNISGITVKSGTNANDLDVGIYKRGSIGDYVWEDKNGNARQDADETGVGEIKVVLTGTNGFGENISQNTKTRADGTYGFDQLIPGNYELRFEIPAPYQYVKADEGSDDDKDSDVKDGKISGINLQSGQNRVSYDAGIYTTTSIGDYVWEDINGNGLQESGETGLSGVGLTLTGTTTLGEQVTQNTTTDATGRYSFVGILPGTYKIGVTKPAGYTLTASDRGSDDNIDSDGIDGLVSNITVGSGTSVSHIDFGMYRRGEIGDFVWEDENGNGRQEGGEAGKSGVNLTLQGTDGQGNPVSRTTTTNEAGAYRFEDLHPGQYRVTITIPDGYSASKAHEGTDENVDSDFENNESGTITLGSGQVVKTVDGGMYRKATLGDFVWHDVNANGIQEANEPGVSGVELTLTGVDAFQNNITLRTQTDNAGKYTFIDLLPGVYRLQVSKPSGFEFGPTNAGANDDVDSDGSNGLLADIIINSGNKISNIDFGLSSGISIGDYVWEDLNINGIQDANEPGIANVSLKLTGKSSDGNDVNLTSTTNSSGNYLFSGIFSGSYTITIQLPEGYTPTKALAGNNKEKDSDLSENINYVTFNLAQNQADLSYDFGLVRMGQIGDLVWEDLNCNGIREVNEKGFEGAKVNLEGVDLFGALIDKSVLTDNQGHYLFNNLKPGQYKVSFTMPVGYEMAAALINVVDLHSGEQVLNVDAPIFKRVTLGDFIWNDANNNGLQDANEVGMPDVKITLTNLNTTEIIKHEVLTDRDGRYLITGIKPGNYKVKIDLPSGYSFTLPKVGTDDSKDSDFDESGNINSLVLLSGDQIMNIDGGLRTLVKGSIGDFVWEDKNGNGVQDQGELGIPNIVVTLTGRISNGGDVSIGTTTDHQGFYAFNDLLPGSYNVQVLLPQGFFFTRQGAGQSDIDSDINPETGYSSTIAITTHETIRTVDAGMYQLSSIGDKVWHDLNANGLQDNGEPGIANVSLSLINTNGETIQSVQSNSSGNYLFANILPGTYRVECVIPQDFLLTEHINADDNINSDFFNDNNSIRTANFILQSNDSKLTIDLGLKSASSNIRGVAWYDSDGNGTIGSSEPLLKDIPVFLINEAGDKLATDTTDVNGKYDFENLNSGKYFVQFTVLKDSLFTIKNAGTDEEIDSDVTSQTTGKSDEINLIGGNITGLNAGFVKYSSIGDYVWLDANEDGLQGSDENGINGIVVDLLSPQGTVIASTTSAIVNNKSGFYSFSHIAYGDYKVRFNTKENLKFTKYISANPDLNSDIQDVATNVTELISVAPAKDVVNIDAGYVLIAPVTGNISGVVWQDNNNDKVKGGGDIVLSGVTVSLFSLSGQSIKTTVSDADGKYRFADIPFGDYYISVPTAADKVFVLYSGQPKSGDSDITNAYGAGTTRVINLFPGETIDNIDLGYALKISIGDFIWDDLNNNGLQDAGEPGLGGITIKLINEIGNVEKTSTSDLQGKYQFSDVPVGKYKLVFGSVNDYLFALNNSSDQNINSKPDMVTGSTAYLDFSVPKEYANMDAGYVKGGAVGSRVWLDLNGNGSFQSVEPGIINIKVKLFTASGVVVDSAYTNILEGTEFTGHYKINLVRPGDYYVKFIIPDTLLLSPSGAADENNDSNITNENGPLTTSTFTVGVGQYVSNIDAAAYKPANIGDRVWNDLNKNGVQDTGEPGVENISVKLFAQSGQLLASTTTNAEGLYKFTNLRQRLYYLQFSIPNGYEFSAMNVSGSNATDSDVDATGTSPLISLAHGANLLDIDAGIHTTNARLIMGNVWNDLNKDGLRTFDEPLKENIKVFLKDSNGQVIRESKTNFAGMYCLSNNYVGEYFVFVESPDDNVFTEKNVGSDPNFDSDVDEEGISDMMELNDTYVMKYIDAGYYYKVSSSVNGVVWKDANSNGLRDSGEPLLPNVVVFLFNKFKTFVKSTKTNEKGEYSLKNIEPGQYYCKLPEYTDLTYVLYTGQNQDFDSEFTNQYGPATSRLVTLVAGVPMRNFDFGYKDVKAFRIENSDAAKNINIYPNPAINDIRIMLPETMESNNASYSIINNLGAQVKNGKLDINSNLLEIEHLPSGRYTIKILLEGQIITRNFVKIDN